MPPKEPIESKVDGEEVPVPISPVKLVYQNFSADDTTKTLRLAQSDSKSFSTAFGTDMD